MGVSKWATHIEPIFHLTRPATAQPKPLDKQSRRASGAESGAACGPARSRRRRRCARNQPAARLGARKTNHRQLAGGRELDLITQLPFRRRHQRWPHLILATRVVVVVAPVSAAPGGGEARWPSELTGPLGAAGWRKRFSPLIRGGEPALAGRALFIAPTRRAASGAARDECRCHPESSSEMRYSPSGPASPCAPARQPARHLH